MNESVIKRRIWIRNALILLLLVLLLLTLFSNTILNYSLPEVAVQYPQYAAITSRINGSGVVEANQNYTVSIEQSRGVESIPVRVGQTVSKGEVLMLLEVGDSRELDEARVALSNLELQLIRKQQEDPARNQEAAQAAYEALLAEWTDAKSTLSLMAEELSDLKAQQAKIPTFDEIQNAKVVLAQAQTMVDHYTTEIARLAGKQGVLGGNGYYTAEEIAELLDTAEQALAAAEKIYSDASLSYVQADGEVKLLSGRLEAAQEAAALAKAAVADYESKRPAGGTTAESLRQKKAEWDGLVVELDQKERYFTEDRYNEAKAAYDRIRNEYETKKNTASPEELQILKNAVEAAARALEPLESDYRALLDLRQRVRLAEQEYSTAVMQYLQTMQSDQMLARLNQAADAADAEVAAVSKSHAEAEKICQSCKEAYEKAEAAKKEAEQSLETARNYESYEALGEEIKEMTRQKNDLEKQMKEAEELIEMGSDEGVRQMQTRINEKNREITAQTKAVNDLEKQVQSAKATADGTGAEAQLSRKQYEIELKQIEDQITKQKKEIARLEKISVERELTSPVSGVIESISALVGKVADANTPLMSIAVSDMGYTVKCTVTAEQAAKIKVGDEATFQWYYWGETPTAKVVSIKADPSSQGKNKTVTLQVSGDVTPGTSVNFTLGNKNATFDCVVPNSAVREDAEGKFVLVVSAKSTPLGNRYTAKRVSVEVVASDETNSALSGAVSGQYVITASASPISDGMQVRLSDNNG